MWQKVVALIFSACFLGSEALRRICFSQAVMDLVFLVDGSKSVTPDDFSRVKSHLLVLVDSFNVTQDRVRIGLAQFSSKVQVEFHPGSLHDTAKIKVAIQKIRQRGGQGNTRLISDILLYHRLTEAAASRAGDGVPQVLVLIYSYAFEHIPSTLPQMLSNSGVLLVTASLTGIANDRLDDTVDSAGLEYTENLMQILCTLAEKPTLQVYPGTQLNYDGHDYNYF
ncbi:hypothetical protein GN956_G14214 [Arapaima gigas]